LLIPTISRVSSRKETNTEANLTPRRLSISIVSANGYKDRLIYGVTMASLGELRKSHNRLRNNRIEKGLIDDVLEAKRNDS